MSGDRSLSRRASGGFAALAFGQGGQVIVQVVTFPILARLIAPDGFGLLAAALVVVNIASLLASLGLGTALVQQRELRVTHIRAAFTLQLAAAIGVFGAVIAAAPWFADLLRMPELTGVLRVMGAASFVRALTLGDALLRRRLEFRPLAAIELTAYAIGHGVVTVGLGLAGYGVWALVLGHLAAAALSTGLLWIVAPHPAGPYLGHRERRDLLGTGIGFTLSQAGYQIAHQADDLIVGRFLGAYSLGLYERAYRLMRLPASAIGHILGQVLYPAMASVQDQRDRLRGMFAICTSALAAVTVPATAVVLVVAHELVLVVLGPDWLELRPVLNVILFGMYLKASESITDSTIVATGAVYRLATRRWLYAGAVILGASIGQRWGLAGVAFGALAAMVVNTLLLVRLSLHNVAMSWSAFLRLHAPAAFITALVLVFVSPTATALRQIGAPAAAVLLAAAIVAAVAVLVASRTAHLVGWTGLSTLLDQLELLAPDPRLQRLAGLLRSAAHRPQLDPDPEAADR